MKKKNGKKKLERRIQKSFRTPLNPEKKEKDRKEIEEKIWEKDEERNGNQTKSSALMDTGA